MKEVVKMKKNTLSMFTEIGMKESANCVKTLKSLHTIVVNAALIILKNGGELLHVCDANEDYKGVYRANYYGAMFIPQPHKNETYRGYMSRLNAWAWEFIYERCVDITRIPHGSFDDGTYYVEDVFNTFYENFALVGYESFTFDADKYKVVYNARYKLKHALGVGEKLLAFIYFGADYYSDYLGYEQY